MVSIESKSIISLFTGIIGIGIVLFLSYYATKFIGKKSIKGKNRGNIKNVDNYYMGADKFLSIVKVGESYLLLGISNDGITLLKELDKSEIKEDNTENQRLNFGKVLSEKIKKRINRDE